MRNMDLGMRIILIALLVVGLSILVEAIFPGVKNNRDQIVLTDYDVVILEACGSNPLIASWEREEYTTVWVTPAGSSFSGVYQVIAELSDGTREVVLVSGTFSLRGINR